MTGSSPGPLRTHAPQRGSRLTSPSVERPDAGRRGASLAGPTRSWSPPLLVPSCWPRPEAHRNALSCRPWITSRLRSPDVHSRLRAASLTCSFGPPTTSPDRADLAAATSSSRVLARSCFTCRWGRNLQLAYLSARVILPSANRPDREMAPATPRGRPGGPQLSWPPALALPSVREHRRGGGPL